MEVGLARLGTVADVHTGEKWTAADLGGEVARRTDRLRAAGLDRGDIAVIMHGGTPSFFADLLAVWRAGACAACVNPGLTEGELANVVDFVGAKIVLVDGEASTTAGGHPARVMSAARDDDLGPVPPGTCGAHLDHPALILFTSGTTGRPKGVVLSFRAILARTALNRAEIGDDCLARVLCVLPTHFGHGLIGNCLTTLLAGGDLLLFNAPGIQGTARLGAVLEDHDVTFMSSVPAFWRVALKAAKRPTRQTLRRVHIGSAPLSAELWQAVIDWTGTDTVVNAFGITETANWAAGASAAAYRPADGLVGRMWGGQAAVRSADGALSGIGDGEVVLQTPSLMTGYFERPDLTDEVLSDGWYRTGDIGRIDEDGTIWLLGRHKLEINRAGMKVHPEELDLLLEQHADVAEACAFAVPDRVSGELVGVAVAPVDGADLDLDGLAHWCAARIRPDARPDRWYTLAEIPKTDRGKVDRSAVTAQCLAEGTGKA